jgi:hypothetical protein
MYMIDELPPDERRRQEALGRVAGAIASIGTPYSRMIARSPEAQRLLQESIDRRYQGIAPWRRQSRSSNP